MINEFLQSQGWEELQKNIGNKTWRLNFNNQSVLIIKKNLPLNSFLGKNYLYIPRLPAEALAKAGAEKNDIKNFLEEIKKIAKQEKSIFLKIEPAPVVERSAFTTGLAQINPELTNTLAQNGFIKSSPIQPEQTLLIDLSQPTEVLLKKMEKQTRQGIRYAEERKVQIIKADNFENFWKLFEATNRRHGLKTYSQNYYQQIISLNGDCQSELFLAKTDNKIREEIIGAVVILFFGNTATYLYAASAAGYNKFNAPTLLIWNAILDAKKRGYKFFDFWGISETNKNWQGITTFKRSFGGQEYRYPGAFDFIFDKKIYLIYKIAKRIINKI